MCLRKDSRHIRAGQCKYRDLGRDSGTGRKPGLAEPRIDIQILRTADVFTKAIPVRFFRAVGHLVRPAVQSGIFLIYE